MFTSGSTSLKNSRVTSCSFFSGPPTPLKYKELFSTLIAGFLQSSKQTVRKINVGLWAHLTKGGVALESKNIYI